MCISKAPYRRLLRAALVRQSFPGIRFETNLQTFENRLKNFPNSRRPTERVVRVFPRFAEIFRLRRAKEKPLWLPSFRENSLWFQSRRAGRAERRPRRDKAPRDMKSPSTDDFRR